MEQTVIATASLLLRLPPCLDFCLSKPALLLGPSLEVLAVPEVNYFQMFCG
jgi:hypothetical protein